MFSIPDESTTNYTYLGLFSGAGGLDLGFEKAGFIHTQSSDILDVAVKTLNANRPHWDVLKKDVNTRFQQWIRCVTRRIPLPRIFSWRET